MEVKIGQKISADYYVSAIEGDRVRVINFEPSKEQIAEWSSPSGENEFKFIPGYLLSVSESFLWLEMWAEIINFKKNLT